MNAETLDIPTDVQEMIDTNTAFIAVGWMWECNLPGYNALFSPNWETLPKPSPELVAACEEHGETPELEIVFCKEGSPGRIGKGRLITPETVTDEYPAQVVARWV